MKWTVYFSLARSHQRKWLPYAAWHLVLDVMRHPSIRGTAQAQRRSFSWSGFYVWFRDLFTHKMSQSFPTKLDAYLYSIWEFLSFTFYTTRRNIFILNLSSIYARKSVRGTVHLQGTAPVWENEGNKYCGLNFPSVPHMFPEIKMKTNHWIRTVDILWYRSVVIVAQSTLRLPVPPQTASLLELHKASGSILVGTH